MVNTSLGHKIKVHLGLGSNQGDRESNLARALGLLPPDVVVSEVSSLYESEPVGFKDQPWFLNIACSAYTDLPPDALLDYVKEIEKQLGRILSFRNAPRPIDIDILFYADQTVNTQYLVVPHPRIQERAFVLMPLAELDPTLLHPGKNETVGQMLSALAEHERIRRRKWSPLHAAGLLRKPSGHIITKGPDKPQS